MLADDSVATPGSAITVDLPAGPLRLLPDRAACLPDLGLLLVADAHLGKAQAFRQGGLPVPAGTTERNLQRLTHLIDLTQPRELVFLGDLLHAKQAHSPTLLSAVQAWRDQHSTLKMTLVRGNHDSRAGDPPAKWGFRIVDEPLRRERWALCHHPQVVDGAHVLAGHNHPGFSVGRGLQRMRLPCFHLSPDCSILPAFGEFTGLHRVQPRAGERVAVVADGHIRLLDSPLHLR
jgi:DNA ligase-associated metallophosphoesterase